MLGKNGTGISNTGKDDISILTTDCYSKRKANNQLENGKYYYTTRQGIDRNYINNVAEEVNNYNPDCYCPNITINPSGVSLLGLTYKGYKIGNGIYYYSLDFTISDGETSGFATVTSNIKPINNNIVCFYTGGKFSEEQFNRLRNLVVTSFGFTAELYHHSDRTLTYRLAFIGEVV